MNTKKPVRAEPVRAEPVRAEPVRAEPVRAEPVRAEPVRAEPAQTDEDCSLDLFKNLSQMEQIILIACIILVLYLLYVSFTGGCNKSKNMKNHTGKQQCHRCGRHIEYFLTCKGNAPGDPCCTKCQNQSKYGDADKTFNQNNCNTCKTNYQGVTASSKFSLANCDTRYLADKANYDDMTNETVRTDARLCGCLNASYKFRANNPNINWTAACSSGRPVMDNYQLTNLVQVARSQEPASDRQKRMKCILAKTAGNTDDNSTYASSITNDCIRAPASAIAL